MWRLFSFLKNTTVLLILCGSLAVASAGLAFRTAALTAQVATMSARAASSVVANRKAIATAVARAKAKARLRRLLVAAPLVGLAVAAEFERRDYQAWKKDHPDGEFSDYGCETATISAEVMDEVLQELPERVRPGRDTVLGLLPGCEVAEGAPPPDHG